jgi:urease accessory protein
MNNDTNIYPSQWQGILNLVYNDRNGETILSDSYNQAPLKIQRSFYPEGKEICHNVILHTAGGMVGGDILSQNIHLQSNTKSLITTAAAGKIYRSNGLISTQNIEIKIDANACLEYLPQETIVFNGAIYRQNLKVELGINTVWLNWEITRFGRSARGEKFLQGEWRSHTEIWQQGNPLWIDRQFLPGGEETFYSHNALAQKSVIGTLAWIGLVPDPAIIAAARELWLDRNSNAEVGVTSLLTGLLCRYRGNSSKEARNWFTDVWQLLRPLYLGRSVTSMRFWL